MVLRSDISLDCYSLPPRGLRSKRLCQSVLLKGKERYIICDIKKTWLWYIWAQMWCGMCSRDLVGLSHILAVCARTVSYDRIEQIRVATEQEPPNVNSSEPPVGL